MKLAIAVVTLSVAVMAVLAFQAVRQELNLRFMRAHIEANSVEVKRKEEAIIEVKKKIQELKATLTSVNAKIVNLEKTKADAGKSKQTHEKSLQACNSEKASDTRNTHALLHSLQS